MGRLATRARAVFARKAARHGSPVTVSGREGTVKVFPEPIPPGGADYLPAGPDNAGDAPQWVFYASPDDMEAPPPVGATITHLGAGYLVDRKPRPYAVEGTIIYWAVFAYQQAADEAAPIDDSLRAKLPDPPG